MNDSGRSQTIFLSNPIKNPSLNEQPRSPGRTDGHLSPKSVRKWVFFTFIADVANNVLSGVWARVSEFTTSLLVVPYIWPRWVAALGSTCTCISHLSAQAECVTQIMLWFDICCIHTVLYTKRNFPPVEFRTSFDLLWFDYAFFCSIGIVLFKWPNDIETKSKLGENSGNTGPTFSWQAFVMPWKFHN